MAATGLLEDGVHECTVLLTDIEESTRLWEQHPEGMERVVRDHNHLIDDVVQQSGGAVARLTGDGVLALFSEGPEAVRAAVAIQRQMLERIWPDIGTMRVRIGLNTGRCTLHGGEVFGRPPNLASRLQSVGHGGQILMSEATAESCTGRLGATEELVVLGRHHIRGFAEPVLVHMVRAEGLPTDFPPLRTAYAGFDELPLDDPVLYGRDDLLGVIERLLEHQRMVTLWGPGGVGKTRLALRVAGRGAKPYRNGSRFVDLSGARNASEVAEAIVLVLRAQPLAGETKLATALRLLRPAELLLVLDNCEHVLSGVQAVVARLLSECPGCQVLATSREPVDLWEERTLEVPPLAVPLASEVLVEVIRLSPAVQLFVDRATQSMPGFELGDDNVLEIAAACRAVDGLPLALELAGARLGIEGLSGGLPRMASAIETSYNRLSPSEAALLRRLCAFSGAFSRDLALAFVPEWPAARPDLDRLVRVALVQREDQLGRSLRLMATTREFLLDRLGPQEQDELFSAHARLMVDRAEQTEPLLRTADERRAVEQFRRDFAETRLAMARLLAGDSIDQASRLLVAVFQFCLFQPRPEAYHWASRLARRIDPAHSLAPEVLGAAALGAWFSGDTEQAVRFGEAALAAGSGHDERSLYWARTALVDAHGFSGNVAGASEHFRMLVASLAASDEPFWRINGLGHLAISKLMRGKRDAAFACASEALNAAQALNNPDCIQWALYARGRARRSDDAVLACEDFEQAMRMSREVDSRFNVSLNLIEWVGAKRRLGQVRAAMSGALDLIDMLAASGNRSLLSQALAEVAALLDTAGRPDAASNVRAARLGLPSMPRGADVGPEQDADDIRTASGRAPNLRPAATTEHELIEFCRLELLDCMGAG